MSAADIIIENLLGTLEEKGTGIFVKRLRNGPIYTCRCPGCSTLHGAFRSYGEAEVNRKCVTCNRHEIERLKKEVEKVNDPDPQKDIFKHPLKKPALREDEEEEDYDLKDISGVAPRARQIAYEIYDGSEYFPVTEEGEIGRQGNKHGSSFDKSWRLMGLYPTRSARRFGPWREIKYRLNAGEALQGYPLDYDHGSYRRWGRKAKIHKLSHPIFLGDLVESLDDDDESIKDILGGTLSTDEPTYPGEVTKLVCMSAHYGQEFYSRTERYTTGQPKRVRVSGKCKTWKTRPNEFKLPVKYGLYQNLYITQANAREFSSIPVDASGNPLR
jgi:hypothetical protein